MNKCKECRFWEQKETKSQANGVIQGVCHRNPPIATGCFMPKMNMITSQIEPQLMELTVWPITTNISWCGQFEGKQKSLKVSDNLNRRMKTKPSDL